VLISPVRGRDRDRLPAGALRDPAAIVFISDPAVPLVVPARWLEDAYGLTPTEARVALSIAAGGALGDAARRLGISHNTAKTHLHRIFAKTDTHRQAELARLIASLAQVRASP
jgi:DNA-binding CsgD family transcriptional regulator